MTGGVNLFNNTRDLRDDEVAYAKNLVPGLMGRLQTRPACKYVGWAGTSSPYPVAMKFLPPGFSAGLILITKIVPPLTPLNFVEVFDGPALGLVNLFENGANIGPGFYADQVSQFAPVIVPYNGKIYIFWGPGASKTGSILQEVAGSLTVSEFRFNGAGNSTLRPAGVANYKERFAYFNFGPGYESALVFADEYEPGNIKPNALASNGSYINLNPNDGDRLVAGIEIMQTGATVATAGLLMLKEYSNYLLSGDALDSGGGGTDSLVNNKMPKGVGCSSPDTICRTKHGVLWAGPDDVWFFPEGQIPYAVGTKISPRLKSAARDCRYRWHAVFHDGFYKLSIHAPGAGATPDAPCGEQWWLDLREGPPGNWREARWFGPQVYKYPTIEAHEGTSCMDVDLQDLDGPKLYSFLPVPQAGASTADRCVLASLDATDEKDFDQVTADAATGPYDSSTDLEIIPELVTKEYSILEAGGQMIADALMEKGLYGAELDIQVSRHGLLAWKWLLNQGRTTSAEQTVEVLAPSGFMADNNDIDASILTDERALVALDPGTSRPVGTGIQIKIYGKPGLYINELNNKITIAYDNGSTFIFHGTVASGYYADMTALHLAVKAAINNAILESLGAGFDTIDVTDVGGNTRISTPDPVILEWNVAYTAPDVGANIALAAILGFTDLVTGYVALSSITGDTDFVNKRNQLWDLGSAVIHMYPIRRRTL
jgi:hypothetical protein